MDIKTLQYFIAVVEATSITKAAKKLHISQPPLSQQLKQLEQELGTKLFERGSRNITLTGAGETLYYRAKNIVDFTEETYREIRNIGSGKSGQVRMGLISSFDPGLLFEMIQDFSAEYPNVQFEIYERNTYELLDSIENNMIELAFVRTPFDSNSDHDRILVSKEPMVAFGHMSYFEGLSENSLASGFFDNKPVIIYRRWKYILNSYFKENNVEPVYSFINDDAKSSALFALSGKGIAIVPLSTTHIIKDESMRYVPIDSDMLATEVYAIWNPERYISPATRNFIETIKKFELR